MSKVGVWGFVPARGGSKSIPYKNLANFGGIPLLDYGVRAAQGSDCLTRIVGSTDSDRIADHMHQLGIECDRRRESLAGDDVPIAVVARDFLHRQKNAGHEMPALLVLIQPTSPFLLSEHIDQLVNHMLADSDSQSGQTIAPCPHNHHEWNQRWFENGRAGFVHASERQHGFNKQTKPVRWIFGNLVAARCKTLLDGHDFFTQPSIAFPIESKYAFDLDIPEDIYVGEGMLSNGAVRLPHLQGQMKSKIVSDYKKYAKQEGIDLLLSAAQERGLSFDAENSSETIAFSPHIEDLCRLHALIRQNRSFTVLEFGVGYSTIMIADALAKNERDFQALPSKPKLRRSKNFMGFCVDTNKFWIKRCQAIMPDSLATRIDITHSEVTVSTFNGKFCHYYNNLPNIIPDFVYLDGPDPAEVKGQINGMDFTVTDRTVMAADLLLMESTLLPGTVILIDGRTNNARFLERNFQRSLIRKWDAEEDYTLLTFDESRLGPHNVLGTDLFPATGH